jgi:hypothetical protein
MTIFVPTDPCGPPLMTDVVAAGRSLRELNFARNRQKRSAARATAVDPGLALGLGAGSA